MGTTPQPPTDLAPRNVAIRRVSELFDRTMVSESIVSSALEVPKVLGSLKQTVLDGHLTGESGIREVLRQYKFIEAYGSQKDFSKIAQVLAEQTSTNVERVISAAAVILSHSIADDVFTEACKLAIELDPKKWIPHLNLDRQVSLKLLNEIGAEGVFEDALGWYKVRLGDKSLPTRDDLAGKSLAPV